MVIFVFLSDPFQNQNRIIDTWSIHLHALKPTIQSTILLNIFPIFIESGCPDTLKLTSRQRRLKNIGSIHGSFCSACTYNGMKLIDKNDHIPRPLDLVHDRFDALFELSSVFRARNHQGQVERDDPLVLKNFWNNTASDL